MDRISPDDSGGEHTAILGPNGAGKSSLIRLIAHLDYPLAHEDGTPPLLIFGEELWNVTELRSLLGIVSADLQHSILAGTLPGRTRGLDAVLSGFFASYGLFRHHHLTPAMRNQGRQALALMSLPPGRGLPRSHVPGEVRRVMIARAWCPIPGPALG